MVSEHLSALQVEVPATVRLRRKLDKYKCKNVSLLFSKIVKPLDYMIHDGLQIFDEEKTLMISIHAESSIFITRSSHALPFCHRNRKSQNNKDRLKLAEAASKADNKSYFMEEITCNSAPYRTRLLINRRMNYQSSQKNNRDFSSSSVDEIVEFLGDFIGTREVILDNVLITTGPNPVLR